jgi:hypothetical protein
MTLMTRLLVPLADDIHEALMRSAVADLRPTRLQATALIREALQGRGALTTAVVSERPPTAPRAIGLSTAKETNS